jgi:nitric oxide synthase oxygenase domain/subunit
VPEYLRTVAEAFANYEWQCSRDTTRLYRERKNLVDRERELNKEMNFTAGRLKHVEREIIEGKVRKAEELLKIAQKGALRAP